MGNCNRSNMGQRECGERYDMSSCQDFALAMAYVPWQHFEHVYEPDRALQIGTIFPELNKPFCGRKGCGDDESADEPETVVTVDQYGKLCRQ